jgi:spore germination protein
MNLRADVSPLQFFIITINVAVGGGMLTLPSSVADAAKEDMWLSVICGGILMLLSLWVAVRLSQYFPECTCIEYHRILLGPILGQVLNLVLLSLIVTATFLALRSFSTAIKLFILDITPLQIIFFVLLLLAVYAIQYELAPFLRFQQLIFVPNYMMLLPLLLLGLLSVSAKHYFPILAEGFTPVMKGAIPSWFSYSGPELVTGMIYPFITGKKQVMKWGAAAIVVLMVFYTMITIIVQGILGPAETGHMVVPTIIAYRAVEIPDTFIERVDGYLMIIWIGIYFCSLASFLYFTVFGAGRMLKLESSRPVSVLLVPLIFYLAIVPPTMQSVQMLDKIYNIVGMVWGLGVLPLLLGIAWLKEKRRGSC